jgi:hypothetical protein
MISEGCGLQECLEGSSGWWSEQLVVRVAGLGSATLLVFPLWPIEGVSICRCWLGSATLLVFSLWPIESVSICGCWPDGSDCLLSGWLMPASEVVKGRVFGRIESDVVLGVAFATGTVLQRYLKSDTGIHWSSADLCVDDSSWLAVEAGFFCLVSRHGCTGVSLLLSQRQPDKATLVI